ncbi:hypothetical protein QR721_03775 [Aciduricibacillus chroicocephali]|uniref:Uncharacterized protein n=1 Tax=Aciduricibacillus chroicocephali TaxID=3054939 RepID=A0ABY9L0C6_9BACI|nr:hypothetical protein QR721_03775 [Bacillaceae bacterium 44XB]
MKKAGWANGLTNFIVDFKTNGAATAEQRFDNFALNQDVGSVIQGKTPETVISQDSRPLQMARRSFIGGRHLRQLIHRLQSRSISKSVPMQVSSLP